MAFLERLRKAPARAVDVAGNMVAPDKIKFEFEWDGSLCRPSITNHDTKPLQLKNIILFDLAEHGLDPATPVYGEGFQMLAQNTGSLGKLDYRGPYPDAVHYKIPEPDGIPTVYGMMTLDLGKKGYVLLGFTSCKRFVGRFSFDGKLLRVSVDPEGLELAPGETWKLEEFIALACRIAMNCWTGLPLAFAKTIPLCRNRLSKTVSEVYLVWGGRVGQPKNHYRYRRALCGDIAGVALHSNRRRLLRLGRMAGTASAVW